MNYSDLDTEQLKKMAHQLNFDSDHLLDTQKVQLAKNELVKVEAELRNRQGIRGILYPIKKLIGLK